MIRRELSRAGTETLLLTGAPLLYVLVLCGVPLFGGEDLVLGARGTDLFGQFIGQREFAFGQLAAGNLPLWNPHIFSGMPALGNIQFALCYPGNLLYLLLPVGPATNACIMLHLALSGILMGFWVRSRGTDLLPSALAGILYLGCGAHFPHVYAGHLTMLCVLAWAPLLFWSVDSVTGEGGLGFVLAGSLALGLMVLAGYPQFVYHIGATAALYAAFRLRRSADRLRKLLRLGLIPILAAGLSAFQIAATVQAQDASLRGGRLSLDYASMFSFPAENLLTLMAPFPFGGSENYWGRAYLWEMELFLGVAALTMAGLALTRRDEPDRWWQGGLALLLLLLALGKNTPLFPLLFEYVPGIALFRGHSKWILPASLLLVHLAARGFHSFLRDPGGFRRLPGILVGIAGSVAAAAGLCLWSTGHAGAVPGWWQDFLGAVAGSGESYAPPQVFNDPVFLAQSLEHLGTGLGLAAATLLALSLLAALARRRPALAAGAVVMALLEIFLFDRAYLTTFPLAEARMPEVSEVLAQDPGDYRVAVLDFPNSAMSTGALDFWGYDPFVPRRYMEFIAFTQDAPLDSPAVDVPLRRWDPLLGLLRLRYAFFLDRGGNLRTEGPYPHLPRALLLSEHRVVRGGHAQLLAALGDPDFNPAREVLLEEEPPFSPVAGADPGRVRVQTASTDEVIVDAEVSAPTLLLLTDPYFPGWRAERLEGFNQTEYPILRADHVLQAIPLRPGRHRLRLIFAPPGLAAWGAVSVATAAGMAALGALSLLRNPLRAQSSHRSVA